MQVKHASSVALDAGEALALVFAKNFVEHILFGDEESNEEDDLENNKK